MAIDPEPNSVLRGNSMHLLEELPENSVHAVVTDPPYNYDGGFMGEEWDNIGTEKEYQVWCERWSEKALRALKPGGHLIAFSGDTTHHRLFSGIEDAGYEIRHTILWLYGTGFPKGARLSTYLEGDDAERWGDWRPLLKPAFEPAVLARAPFSGSATANQVEHGTGNLNVENGRIPTEDDLSGGKDHGGKENNPKGDIVHGSVSGFFNGKTDDHGEGRYPPDAALDETAAAMLDEQSGNLRSPNPYRDKSEISDGGVYGNSRVSGSDGGGKGDEGGASRFFYTSKASKSERTHDGQVENDHKTVKPIDLMEWLIGLVTAEGQRILDPFCGSGSTLIAAENTDREYIGIDLSKDSARISRERLAVVAD